MSERAVAFIGVFAFLIALVLAFVVGVFIADTVQDDVDDELQNQLRAACNEELSGEGWSIANDSVSVDNVGDARNVTCRRGGQVERISVNVSIELQG